MTIKLPDCPPTNPSEPGWIDQFLNTRPADDRLTAAGLCIRRADELRENTDARVLALRRMMLELAAAACIGELDRIDAPSTDLEENGDHEPNDPALVPPDPFDNVIERVAR